MSDEIEAEFIGEDEMGDDVDEETIADDQTEVEVSTQVAQSEMTDLPTEFNDPAKHRRPLVEVKRIVPPDSRMTSNIVSEFEMTMLTSIRAQQIDEGDDALVDCDDLKTGLARARRELMQRRCPLSLERGISTIIEDDKIVHIVEIWDVNEMVFSKHYDD